MISENISNCSTFEILIPFAYDANEIMQLNEVFKEDILKDFTTEDNIEEIHTNKEDLWETYQYRNINKEATEREKVKRASILDHKKKEKAITEEKQLSTYKYLRSSRRKNTNIHALEVDVQNRDCSNKLLSIKRKLK